MASAITYISSVTVGSGGVANIEFTGIPNTYTDLLIQLSSRVSASALWDDFTTTFNGSSSSLSSTWGNAEGGSTAGYGSNGSNIFTWTTANTATSNTFGNHTIYIPNYAGSTNKILGIDGCSENNAANAIVVFTSGQWASSSAITSVKLTDNNTFMQYTTAYLYGISNA
jgi:hypothetical protein